MKNKDFKNTKDALDEALDDIRTRIGADEFGPSFVIGAVIGLLLLSFFITAGMWWVVLWSFSFPIAFTWKSVFGVMIITGLLSNKRSIKWKK